MARKLAAIVVAVGLTAIGLLVMRQARLNCAHELTQVHRRLIDHEQATARLRIEIESLVSPAAIDERHDRLRAQAQLETGG